MKKRITSILSLILVLSFLMATLSGCITPNIAPSKPKNESNTIATLVPNETENSSIINPGTNSSTETNAENNTGINTGTNTGMNTGMNTGTNTEMNTGMNTGMNTESNTEINSETNTEINSESNTETNTETNTEINTESNTESDTESNIESNTESNISSDIPSDIITDSVITDSTDNTSRETESVTNTESTAPPKATESVTNTESAAPPKATESVTNTESTAPPIATESATDNKVEVNLSEYAPTRSGTTVTFGSYPQSKVTNSTILSKLNTKAGTPSTKASAWTSYGYYENEEMWYADVKEGGVKYRGVYFSAYRPTDISKAPSASNAMQDDNGYALNTVHWFVYEPITWTVLKTSGGKSLIFCNKIIDSQCYSASKNNNYAESVIRAWLNDTFVQTAFNEYQRKFILVTEVDNSKTLSDYTGSHPFLCENTKDRVFLLSKKEIKMSEYGFTSDASRVKKMTEYTKSQGAYANSANEGWWWLRTPTYDSDQPQKNDLSHNIKVAGNINSTNVGTTSGCIIPAMWVVFDVANIQNSPDSGSTSSTSNKLPDYPSSTTSYNCYDETTMLIASSTNLNTFKTYCNVLKAKGYTEYSKRDNVNGNYYRTYTKGSTAITVYFIKNTNTVRIISGPLTDIPSKTVDKTAETYTPSVTLLSQGAEKGSGLGLIFRLPNGKFFIYDGGYAQNDALYNKLKSIAGKDKIVIAAWVISHPHQDHQEA